jgi:SPX domain protein involved in polyphosphate accumulation
METKNTFKRKERKYLVDKDTAFEVMNKLDEMLYRKKFRKGNEDTFIRSVYFDSDDFKCYIDHKNREKIRFKIRIRQYGNGKEYYKRCFVELKEKINGMNYKRRFKVKEHWLSGLALNEIDFYRLKEYNKIDILKLTSIYQEILEKMHRFTLHPVLQVNYHRRAYENSEQSVRITFDDNLSFGVRKSLTGEPDKLYNFSTDKMIMETKTFGIRPYWLLWLLDEYGLKKQKFSKYCTGIETVYAESNCIDRILNINDEEVIYNE